MLPPNPRARVIGHRGASGYRPEHTRSSYELALALDADAVEPDLVASRDGVLVLRHENEISGTTDVGERAEFADRHATKVVDGRSVTGWFTEDFTWAELQTLLARERLPKVRPASASFDRAYGLLALPDLLRLLDEAGEVGGAGGARPGLVAEIKHATYFESLGLPLDELLARDLAEAGWNGSGDRLTVEAFEQSVLGKVRARGVRGELVFLLDSSGSPYDEIAARGAEARTYADHLTDEGLAELAGLVDGISVDKGLVLPTDAHGHADAPTDLVARAHAVGLRVFCWTLRSENRFLPANFRYGGGPSSTGDYESEWLRILGTGIDGVFADQPDLAVAVRDAEAAARAGS
jgi:glycerophosphoryl diester phosphodiesterase